jgi:general secretion pathway protein B
MSYILDALRKSDQQRQHAKAPTLLTAQSTLEVPRPRTYAFNAWIAMALIGAGVLIGWLQPWQTPAPLSAPGPVTTHAKAVEATKHIPVMPDVVEAPELAPPQRVAAVSTPASSSPPISLATQHTSRLERSTSASQPTANTGDLANETAPASTENPGKPRLEEIERENNILPFSDLPAPIRQEIPNILIAFLQYSSTPTERRVMINNLVLHQGELIAPGLKLERITPEGVVISYQGYRFSRGIR